MRWKLIVGIVSGVLTVLIVAIYFIASSYDFNRLKPEIGRAARETMGRELKLAGNIGLKIGLHPVLVAEDVSYQNASWGSRPELAFVKKLEMQVALFPLISGRIELKRLGLIEPDILIETDKTGKLNLVSVPAKESPPAAADKKGAVTTSSLTLNEVEIEKGRLVFKDGETARTYSLALEKLSASSPSAESPVRLELKGAFNDKPFEVTGTVGSLIAFTDPQGTWPLKITCKAGNSTLTMDGAIKDPLARRGMDITFDLQGREADKAGQLAGLSIPAAGVFHVSGRAVDTGEKAYKFHDLKIALGATDLSGTVDLNLSGKTPKVTASLSGQKLDLRPFMPDAAGKASREATARRGRVFSAAPISIEPPKVLDADCRIQAGEILTPRLVLNDTTLTMALAGGVLDVKSISTKLGGGALDARGNVSTKGKAFALRMVLKAKGLDLARVTKEFEASKKLEGHLDLDMDIAGTGESVADLMSSLNGKTLLVVGNSRIQNKYIDLLGADFSSGAFRLLNPLSRKTEYTEINCFVGGFDIRNGLAKSTGLVLDTNHVSVAGEGTINLKTEGLDIALKPSPKEGIGLGGLGKVSISAGELAKALRLSGTLDNPSLAIDPAQSGIALGKAAGSMALFGPAGIAAWLAGGSSGQGNPCLQAIEAARKGVRPSDSSEKKSIAEKASEGGKKAVSGAGDKVKKLFGR
ncbi:MAG: AsmA family protein [Syntrophobacteraceae bacterium]